MPKFLYHIDTYARDVDTEIKSAFEEDGKKIVALRDCLFHPQGGGQKGDRGVISVAGVELKVVDTIKDPYADDGAPIMIVEGDIEAVTPGQSAQAKLDWDFREKQMRLHGAVHMHHCAMEDILGQKIPTPRTSDLMEDGTAFNRYETDMVNEDLAVKATERLAEIIANGAPVTMEDDAEREGFRWWHCNGHSIPCGGTHLKDMREVGPLAISYTQKKGKPKITITAK